MSAAEESTRDGDVMVALSRIADEACVPTDGTWHTVSFRVRSSTSGCVMEIGDLACDGVARNTPAAP